MGNAGRPGDASSDTASPADARPPEVLVVDDETDIRDSLRSLLQDELPWVHVHVAPDGAEALQILKDHRIDLILCDYRMPDMDGLEFLAHAGRLRRGTPAIMITAYPDAAIAQTAVRDLGVALLVAKPMDLDYLVALVHGVLEGRNRPYFPT